jgi:hypothetical protein
MSARRNLGAVTALLVSLGVAGAARAHEVRPAYLEIQETAPGRYDVLWRTPVLAGMRLPVVLKLPDGVRNLAVPSVQELTDSLVERRQIDAGPEGLAGRRIEFVGLELSITDVLVRVALLDGRKWTSIAHPARPWVEIGAAGGSLGVLRTYLVHGIEHIAFGIDHLLFLLALILIVPGTRALLLTITAFTVAHSLTLALATLGFVHVPTPPVEAAIALSIVLLAAELVPVRRGEPGLAARRAVAGGVRLRPAARLRLRQRAARPRAAAGRHPAGALRLQRRRRGRPARLRRRGAVAGGEHPTHRSRGARAALCVAVRALRHRHAGRVLVLRAPRALLTAPRRGCASVRAP